MDDPRQVKGGRIITMGVDQGQTVSYAIICEWFFTGPVGHDLSNAVIRSGYGKDLDLYGIRDLSKNALHGYFGITDDSTAGQVATLPIVDADRV